MRRLLPLLLTALLFASCGRGGSSAPPPIPADQLTVLRARLASQSVYYYELRLSDKAVVLCHSGVDLARYPCADLHVGLPRILWFTRGSGTLWLGEIWESASLDPPLVVERVQVIPGNESTRPTPDIAGVLPPTLKDLTPVPRSFKIVFPDSRCIQVDMKGTIAGKVLEVGAFRRWWGDFLQGLGLRPSHRVRLKLQMDAESGAALYRSFPESPPVLVLP